jgi:hypothetical protein
VRRQTNNSVNVNIDNNVKGVIKIIFILFLPVMVSAQIADITIQEVENTMFKGDMYWRGGDGAATVQLSSGKILWLFSDTFIDQDGTGKRSNSRALIRNSIAIQDSNSLKSKMTYYYKGTNQKPEDYFVATGKNWFWTGNGISIMDKVVIFLIEETSTNSGMGFEAVGWHVAVIDNPAESPDKWKINYYKGSKTFGVIVGSAAVLQDENYVYAFGIKEPATHETYLFRFEKKKLVNGDVSNIEWWVKNRWTYHIHINEEPKSSSLFIGQTEFSVNYDQGLKKYIQIQTYGFGNASIGYRLADQLSGPWSEPVLFYTPFLKEQGEFVYTANAHPEYHSDELIITYNINNGDFARLMSNEEVYFPKLIKIRFERD